MSPEKRFAPYGPPGTILKIIRNFRDRDVPEQITPEILAQLGVGEGLLNRVMQSLEFLGLINEDGTTTPEFQAIPTKSDPEYNQLLAGLVRNAYKGIFSLVNVAEASDQDLFNAFRPFSPAGQRPRMVTLFRGLCREAGILVGGETASAPKVVREKRSGPRPPKQKLLEQSPPPITMRNGRMPEVDDFETLIEILDPENMSEEEQSAVWTLIRYLKKRATPATQQTP